MEETKGTGLRYCKNCKQTIPERTRRHAQYCNTSCRVRAYHRRKGGAV